MNKIDYLIFKTVESKPKTMEQIQSIIYEVNKSLKLINDFRDYGDRFYSSRLTMIIESLTGTGFMGRDMRYSGSKKDTYYYLNDNGDDILKIKELTGMEKDDE